MLATSFDADALREQFRTAEPFRHVVIDPFLPPETAAAVADAMPAFQQAVAVGTSFRTVNEQSKVQVEDADHFPPAIRELHDYLHGPFLETLAHITDIPDLIADPGNNGGGIHQTGPGGRLDVHVDFNYLPQLEAFRRLNLLLYLNPDWEDDWGGNVELWDPDVKHCVRSVAPKLNRCLIFETNDVSYHGVTKVTCPPEEARRSYSAYFYTHAAPPGFQDNFHGTVFRARPQERWKGLVAMPLETLWGRLKHVFGRRG